MNGMLKKVAEKAVFGSSFFQAVSASVIKKLIEKALKERIGPYSKIVVETFDMEHTDGEPVKIKTVISGEIAECDILKMISRI